MKRSSIPPSVISVMLVSVIVSRVAGTEAAGEKYLPGVLGKVYNEPDFTPIKPLVEPLEVLETKWDDENGHGRDWSAIWEGYIIAPADATVSLILRTNKTAALELPGYGKIEAKASPEATSARVSIEMEKGKPYRFLLRYIHTKGGEAYWNVTWAWPGHEESSIPAENLAYDKGLAKQYNWFLEPDPESIDYSQFATAPAEHVIVAYEAGRTRMCPANNGFWMWGNEILFGMTRGYYKDKLFHHSVDRSKPSKLVFGRSLDGGQTWTEEKFHVTTPREKAPLERKGDIRFTHPDFALIALWGKFYISYDRGKSWAGPYHWPDLGTDKITTRTSYVVNGEKDCHFFLSAKEERVEARLRDRAFCARTTDGGKTFKFLSWMTGEPINTRSVMPSTVRISENHLISAMRRRHDRQFPDRPPIPSNWIDVYQSLDNGSSWRFLSKVADTDHGKWNGNPPTLLRLKDGRLCVTYCFRGVPYSLRARLSEDNGKTWGKEILLRDDARKWDMGYTRAGQRPDGKIVTVYWWTTQTHKEPHAAATIWDPDRVTDAGHRPCQLSQKPSLGTLAAGNSPAGACSSLGRRCRPAAGLAAQESQCGTAAGK